MVNIFQIGPNIYQISIALIASLIVITITALNIIKEKRINIFTRFFIFGVGVCLFAGFMFYGFFGVATDVFYIFSLVSVIGMFFILRGAIR